LGIDTRVYLGSAELSAVCALLGRIPTRQEYLDQVSMLAAKSTDIYRYMNFDKLAQYAG
jgi:aconitate hydratase 2/2-methylisocitrate dehydratase